MSGRAKFSLGIGALALFAILAVAVPKIDVGGSEEESSDPVAGTTPTTTPPSSPDEVKGNEERSLTRPANFGRALAVLEKRRVAVEGVYDGLRVAPGRIDTTVETKDRRMHLQVRTDFKIGFATDSEFPNRPDFRRYGLTAKDVDVRAPAQILERIDGVRKGASAAEDVDYVVIRRDIIDFKVNTSAFLRSGPPPRAFSQEPGEPFRVIG